MAINQIRIDTPGCVQSCIIPDIVLFVNEIPLVVEAKDINQIKSNPMYEGFRQLMRYSGQRQGTHDAGLREGEPKLFHTNQFIIRSCGDHCEFGTVNGKVNSLPNPTQNPTQNPTLHSTTTCRPNQRKRRKSLVLNNFGA